MMNKKGQIATVLLGSAVTVAGLAAFVYLNDSAREKVEGMINREKAKSFVKHTLNGSEALVSAVDHLDDTDRKSVV